MKPKKPTTHGLHRVRKRLADGSIREYFYAWRGGPALPGKPGSPEFLRALADIRERHAAPNSLEWLIERYRSSPAWQAIKPNTRKSYLAEIDRIRVEFGKLPLAALQDKRFRRDIFTWRDSRADTPASADRGIAVLSALLGWAVSQSLIDRNPAAEIPKLSKANRSELIWTPAEIDQLCASANPPLAHAVRLASLTGLRRGDLIALQWADVGKHAIQLKTRKRGRNVIVPILPQVRELLDQIRANLPQVPNAHVLRTSHGKPWGETGLTQALVRARAKAGIKRPLTFHDLRGTAATRFAIAGLSTREIAQIMGWSEKDTEALLARYVSGEAIAKAMLDRLSVNQPVNRENETGLETEEKPK